MKWLGKTYDEKVKRKDGVQELIQKKMQNPILAEAAKMAKAEKANTAEGAESKINTYNLLQILKWLHEMICNITKYTIFYKLYVLILISIFFLMSLNGVVLSILGIIDENSGSSRELARGIHVSFKYIISIILCFHLIIMNCKLKNGEESKNITSSSGAIAFKHTTLNAFLIEFESFIPLLIISVGGYILVDGLSIGILKAHDDSKYNWIINIPNPVIIVASILLVIGVILYLVHANQIRTYIPNFIQNSYIFKMLNLLYLTTATPIATFVILLLIFSGFSNIIGNQFYNFFKKKNFMGWILHGLIYLSFVIYLGLLILGVIRMRLLPLFTYPTVHYVLLVILLIIFITTFIFYRIT